MRGAGHVAEIFSEVVVAGGTCFLYQLLRSDEVDNKVVDLTRTATDPILDFLKKK
jgi:hypothetical protein